MVKAPTAVCLVTLALALETALAGAGVLLGVVQGLALTGLLLVPWMVIVVLRDTSVQIRDLEPGEEWGYQDRPDLRPGR